MPILFTLLAIGAAVIAWYWRIRHTADFARGATEMGRGAIGAARPWNFKRRTNVHAVDAVDDPALAKGAIATAFLELGERPTTEDRDRLLHAVERRLAVDRAAAEELASLGRRLCGQCGGPTPALQRLARRLRRIEGPDAIDDVVALIKASAPARLTPAQRDALQELGQALGRR